MSSARAPSFLEQDCFSLLSTRTPVCVRSYQRVSRKSEQSYPKSFIVSQWLPYDAPPEVSGYCLERCVQFAREFFNDECQQPISNIAVLPIFFLPPNSWLGSGSRHRSNFSEERVVCHLAQRKSPQD